MSWVVLDHRNDEQLGLAQNEEEALELAQSMVDQGYYVVDVYWVDVDGRYVHLDLITAQDEREPSGDPGPSDAFDPRIDYPERYRDGPF